MENTTAIVPVKGIGTATTSRGNAESEPLMLRKRIGSTTFLVNVYFSSTSKETLDDKNAPPDRKGGGRLMKNT